MAQKDRLSREAFAERVKIAMGHETAKAAADATGIELNKMQRVYRGKGMLTAAGRSPSKTSSPC